MCSMHMLPRRPERRQRIYDRIFEQGCTLCCVFEGITLAEPADVRKLEELLVLSEMTAREPFRVALD